jgi:hypothetical protein
VVERGYPLEFVGLVLTLPLHSCWEGGPNNRKLGGTLGRIACSRSDPDTPVICS